MKKISILLLIVTVLSSQLRAKEGMWLPFLLEQLNEKDMKSLGMKITAQDIYSESKSSLKDAICLFGGGCTGEVVSREGLLFTNHHCGYGTAQSLSTMTHNYLQDGFWAKSKSEELPCPGLTVTFIDRIVDVTAQLTSGVSSDLRDTNRSKEINKRIDALVKAETKAQYSAQVKSMYNENKYYLFIMVKYQDVRMVGFPPNGIGKFGGDTDNWAWPRHTGDFSVFRIYVDSNNAPAKYSASNVPYKPKRFLKINIDGVQEGDFTMVYGFPGRTQQNLTSAGVQEVMTVLDPHRIKIRDARLQIIDAAMAADSKVFLQYASKQAGIANAYKKWKGELLGLNINKAVDKKLEQEKKYAEWLGTQAGNSYNVADSINAVHPRQKDALLMNLYMDEAFGGCEALQQGAELHKLLTRLQKTKSMDSVQNMKAAWDGFFKNYDAPTDPAVSKKMIELLRAQLQNELTAELPASLSIEQVYASSALPSQEKINAIFAMQSSTDAIKAIQEDKGYLLWLQLNNKQASNFETLRKYQFELIALHHDYTAHKMKMNEGLPYYPDANSTLRCSYGKVQGLLPRDGITYKHYTTLAGAVAKYNPSVEEFDMPSKLIELNSNKDFGNYAMPNGEMPLAFLASNHTTGGNSGSPVLNAYGDLIGTNFDRIWEGTMSDILYDINLCRNITLDVRYTLFIIDKFGGAGWLLQEMDLVKRKAIAKGSGKTKTK